MISALSSVQISAPSFLNFSTSGGGVLYPPNSFYKDILREDLFCELAPYADDIWFWVMALVHNRKIRVVKNHNRNLIVNNYLNQLFSNNLYKENRNGGNDIQLKNLLKFYGQNIVNKLR